MHIHVSVYASVDILLLIQSDMKNARVTQQTEYLTGFLYGIAQINQKCIYSHLHFDVFKQSFLLQCFSI